MKVSELKEKSILILGLGKEGMDNFEFLKKIFPNKILGLADQLKLKQLSKEKIERIKKGKKIRTHFGRNYLKAIPKYDVILKTPGVPFRKVKPFLIKGQKLSSQTEIFLENCKTKIVGVTGTKGKGTTTSLIYKIFKKSGKKTELIGNIGNPVFSFLFPRKKYDVFVYELSSHQLQGLKISPKISVFLNLYQAHLDHFKNFSDYKKAKQNIAIYQSRRDYFLYNKDSKFLRNLAEKTKAKKISFSLKSKNADCYSENGWIFYKGKKVLKEKDICLIGKFNLYNVMAAICVAKLFGISNNTIRKAVKSFKPMPHRIEFSGKFKGIEFYNDSLATVPEATIFGIEVFQGRVQTILLGGHDAGQNFEKLSNTILKNNIKNLIFFPPVGKKISKEIKKRARILKKDIKNLNFFFVNSMEQAVKICFKKTEKGKVCLLSCAAPSFGIFKDYKERGDLFKKFVKLYGKAKSR